MTAEPDVDYDAVLQYRRHANPGSGWMATARFGLRPAPAGLALVQDLLNTAAQPHRFADLLATVPGARRWSSWAARAWLREWQVQVQAPVLARDDLAGLRDLRGVVEGFLRHGAAADSVRDLGAVTMSLSRRGDLCWLPAGDGWRWWSAAICAEVLASQEKETWSRLKQCAGATCRVGFYDRSWDNSGVVHASTCVAHAAKRTGSRAAPDIRPQRAGTFLHPIATEARS